MNGTALVPDRQLRDLAADALSRCGADPDALPGTTRVDVVSPVTGEAVATVPFADAADVERAIDRAHTAFLQWRTVPAPVRGRLVKRFGELLTEHQDALADLVGIEVGKIVSEARGEVQEMIDICDLAVGLSRQLEGRTMPSERPGHRLMETWHPLGVVGVISAFNFPCAVWAWNAAIALVCGDTVVWKPSERTPLVAVAAAALLDRAARETGAPDGLNTVVVTDAAGTAPLLDSPRVPLVSATGSERMGAAVAPRVAARFGRTILELGGNNAAVVAPSADLDLAVRAIVFSAAGTAGQRCTTLRRLIVHESVADAVVEKVAAAYRSLRVGDPFAPGTLVGPLHSPAAFALMQEALAQAVADGGTVVAGGERVGDGPGCLRPSRGGADAGADRGRPARDVRADPLRAHLPRPGRGDPLHNDVPQGLSSSIFTSDQREAELFLAARRRGLRDRQRQHRHVGRGDRRRVRRGEEHGRRPRVGVGRLARVHAAGDEHRQLLPRPAVGAGRQLRLTRIAEPGHPGAR